MARIAYDDAPHPVRDDIVAVHERTWRRLARPGAWWSGAERVAIAAEARNATNCALCRARKEALSPEAVAGVHDHLGQLPANVVEVIHRVRTDPARLTERWMRKRLEDGLSDAQYVEIIGVVANIVAVDSFARALGVAPRELPEPEPGKPSRYRPATAKMHGAWVPMIAAEDASGREADLYAGRRPANIRSALSLVPDEARGFFDLVETQYLPGPAMRDFAREYRAITHAQIELLAGRVSAINQCTY